MMGTTPMDSRGLTLMVMPEAVLSRSADPLPGVPRAMIPTSSDVRATDLMPMSLRTNASMSEENLSPWETTASL